MSYEDSDAMQTDSDTDDCLPSHLFKSERLKRKEMHAMESHPAMTPPADASDLLTNQPLELTSTSFVLTNCTYWLVKILELLPSETLAVVGGVCRLLHSLANEERHWKRRCKQFWHGDEYWDGGMFPRCDYTHLVGTIQGDFTSYGFPAPPNSSSMLTCADMIQVLKNRGRDVREYSVDDGGNPVGIALADLERAVIESVPEGVQRVEPASPTGLLSLISNAALSRMYGKQREAQPRWMSKWKCAFVASSQDLRRRVITENELVIHEWTYVASGWTETPGRGEPVIRFFPVGENGTGIRALATTTFSYPRPRTWSLDARGRLQVGQFPRHDVVRRGRFGWEMSNGWVTYRSLGVAPIPNSDTLGAAFQQMYSHGQTEAFFW